MERIHEANAGFRSLTEAIDSTTAPPTKWHGSSPQQSTVLKPTIQLALGRARNHCRRNCRFYHVTRERKIRSVTPYDLRCGASPNHFSRRQRPRRSW